jgi:uncharacterized protein (TIGR03083 family)
MSDDNPQTPETELPKNKAELLARIQRSSAELEALLAQLSEQQLTTPGGLDGWSVKDHIGHLTPWQQGMNALLRRQPRHEGMGLTQEQYLSAGIETLNALLQRRSSAQPLDEVLATFRQSRDELLQLIERLPEEDLFKPYHYFQPDEPGERSDRPILAWVAGNTYEHYDEHREWIGQLVA